MLELDHHRAQLVVLVHPPAELGVKGGGLVRVRVRVWVWVRAWVWVWVRAWVWFRAWVWVWVRAWVTASSNPKPNLLLEGGAVVAERLQLQLLLFQLGRVRLLQRIWSG